MRTDRDSGQARAHSRAEGTPWRGRETGSTDKGAADARVHRYLFPCGAPPRASPSPARHMSRVERLAEAVRAMSWWWDVRAFRCRYEGELGTAAIASGGPCLVAVFGPEALVLPACGGEMDWPGYLPALLFRERALSATQTTVAALRDWIGWLAGYDLPGLIAGVLLDRRLLFDALAGIDDGAVEIWVWAACEVVRDKDASFLMLESPHRWRLVLAAMSGDVPADYPLPVWPALPKEAAPPQKSQE